jgi:cell division protein ZapA
MTNKPPAQPDGYTTVTIYDQPYHLTGQDKAHIQRLAETVDAKMRAVASQGQTVDSLRVAVLAALNLADELSQAQRAAGIDTRQGHARANNLRLMLDQVLAEDEKSAS